MTEKLKRRISDNKKLKKSYENLEFLLSEINKKEISNDLVIVFNQKVSEINDFEGEDKKLIGLINRTHSELLVLLKTRLGIIKRGYYENNWQAIGISFGLLIGAVIYALTEKPIYIPLGLPIGMSIGMVIGMIKDKKVKNENRQIRIDEY